MPSPTAVGPKKSWLWLAPLCVTVALAAWLLLQSLEPQPAAPRATARAEDDPAVLEAAAALDQLVTAAAADGDATAPRTPQGVTPPDSRLLLEPPARGRIRGLVAAAERVPFPPSVELYLEPQGAPEDGKTRVAWTTPERRSFDFQELPFGNWRLRLSAGGYREVAQLLTVDETRPDLHVILPLEIASAIRGRVLDETGERVRGVRITAQEITDEPTLAVMPLQGVSDLNGEFVLEGALPGRYRVHAGPPRNPLGETSEIHLASGEAWAELIVPVTGRADLRIVDLGSGRPVPGIRVIANKNDRERGYSDSGTAGDDGRLSFPHLPPGDYSFTAYDQEHRRRVVQATVFAERAVEVLVEVTPYGPPR